MECAILSSSLTCDQYFMSNLPSKRRPVRRRSVAETEPATDASTPIPTGPGSSGDASCGHGKCYGPQCSVRYVGPTSHLRDHHAMHASRGMTHVWMAAIVTGTALVLTGALAFTSVQAKEVERQARQEFMQKQDWGKVTQRLEAMEKAMRDIRELCAKAGSMPTPRPLPPSSTSTNAQ